MSDISNSRSVGEKSLFNTIYRSFGLGDDIFISHSRTDGIDYAKSLARSLQKDYQLKCFADFYWTEIGEKLPPFLVKKLKRSTILIVVMSEGADKSSHNIKEEIEIFRKTGRPILIVDLDNKYQKDNWTEICGISVIRELSKEQIASDKKIEPSPSVLESISESFNYKTKYDQQRRSARSALLLLFISLISVIGASVYANKMIAQAEAATKEKNAAVEEKNIAQTERETAVQEKKQINQELIAIQGRLDIAQNDLNTTQATLKNKEADLTSTKADLKTTIEQKRTAETETQTAKAETQIAREKENKANENIKSLDIRAMGSRASLLSTAADQKFDALELATQAVEKELALNNNSFENLSAEVRKGLTDSVIGLDFSRPLKNDLGRIINTEISGDGKLIFGTIQDIKNQEKLWRVVWETARADKYYLLKEDPFESSDTFLDPSFSILDATFSRDGKWLFVPYDHRIEVWKIDRKDGNYEFAPTPPVDLTADEGIRQIASNRDGTRIAIHFYNNPGKIKIISRKDNDFSAGDYLFLPYGIRRIVFSPQDELILDNVADKRRFYNLTKGEFIVNYELKFNDYELNDITDFGDFLLKRNGLVFIIETFPKYILVNHSDGFITQSWSHRYSDSRSQFEVISSLKFINRNSIKVGQVNDRFSVISQSSSPRSFIYDFKEMSDIMFPHDPLKFYNFKDKSTMGISNSLDTGIVNQQTGQWNALADLTPSGMFQRSIWLEKTDKYLYFFSVKGFDEDIKSSLQIKNLEKNKTVQCEFVERNRQGNASLLYEKYPAIIVRDNAKDFFLSIYDPDDCREIIKTKLEIPEYRLKGSNSEYPVNHLYIGRWYIDGNNVLKGLLNHSQEKENYFTEGVILSNYFLITCDLSKIKLLHNSAIEKETKLSMNIHELPFETAKYQWVSLVSNNFGAMIWMENYIDPPLLFEFKDNIWNKKTLEFDATEQKESHESAVFSSFGDSVAIMDGLTVRIWDTATGKRKLTLTIPESIREGEQLNSNSLYSDKLKNQNQALITSQQFVFSPDGKSIGVVTKDKQIKFYPTSIEEYYYLAKELLK